MIAINEWKFSDSIVVAEVDEIPRDDQVSHTQQYMMGEYPMLRWRSELDEVTRRIQARVSSHPISFEDTKSMLLEPFDLKNHLQIDSSKMSTNQSVNAVLRWLKERE